MISLKQYLEESFDKPYEYYKQKNHPTTDEYVIKVLDYPYDVIVELEWYEDGLERYDIYRPCHELSYSIGGTLERKKEFISHKNKPLLTRLFFTIAQIIEKEKVYHDNPIFLIGKHEGQTKLYYNVLKRRLGSKWKISYDSVDTGIMLERK